MYKMKFKRNNKEDIIKKKTNIILGIFYVILSLICIFKVYKDI